MIMAVCWCNIDHNQFVQQSGTISLITKDKGYGVFGIPQDLLWRKA